jgi:hypothetical protein
MAELIGWIATVFIILSFIQKDFKKLRILSLVGAFIWIIYGVLNEGYSVIFLNFVIILIQIWWLIKLKK